MPPTQSPSTFACFVNVNRNGFKKGWETRTRSSSSNEYSSSDTSDSDTSSITIKKRSATENISSPTHSFSPTWSFTRSVSIPPKNVRALTPLSHEQKANLHRKSPSPAAWPKHPPPPPTTHLTQFKKYNSFRNTTETNTKTKPNTTIKNNELKTDKNVQKTIKTTSKQTTKVYKQEITLEPNTKQPILLTTQKIQTNKKTDYKKYDIRHKLPVIGKPIESQKKRHKILRQQKQAHKSPQKPHTPSRIRNLRQRKLPMRVTYEDEVYAYTTEQDYKEHRFYNA